MNDRTKTQYLKKNQNTSILKGMQSKPIFLQCVSVEVFFFFKSVQVLNKSQQATGPFLGRSFTVVFLKGL